MLREHYYLFKRLLWTVDAITVAAAYVLSRWLATGAVPTDLFGDPALWIVVSVSAISLGVGKQAYEFRFRRLTSVYSVLIQRWGIAFASLLAIFFVWPHWSPDRVTIGIFAVMGLATLMTLRMGVMYALRSWRRSGHSFRNAVVIGTGPMAQRMVDSICAQPERGVHVVGFLDNEPPQQLWSYREIPWRGPLSALPGMVKSEQIDYVLFCVEGDRLVRMNGLVRLCVRMGVPAVIITDWYADFGAHRRTGDFLGHPGLMLDTTAQEAGEMVIRDLIDRVLVLAGIILALPIMIAAACAIRMTSKGPLLFSQVRMGKNGRRFRMWKFRTMVADAEGMRASLQARNEMSGPVFKISDDPRVTTVGRFLRRSSIDELPQLFNVLRGEMSLVGPRPPLPEEVRHYTGRQRRRLSVKPGLTCLWQISGRSNVDFDEWMKLDLQYIDDRSMAGDAEILLKTIPAVLRGRGAK